MSTLTTAQLIVVHIAVVFGFLRFILPSTGQVHKEDIFKDFAHIFVGGLFGAAFVTNSAFYWYWSIGLSLLELIAFLRSKRLHKASQV